MTKKIVAVFAVLFLIGSFAFADDYQSAEVNPNDRTDQVEVYLGYGSCSVVPVIVTAFGSLFGALAGADEIDGHMYGVVSAGVNKYLANWFILGLYGSYEAFDLRFDDQEKSVMSITTIQGRMTFQYGPQKVKFYHALNAGMAFFNGGEENSRSFMCGFTPFGIKADVADNLAVYCELGFLSNAFVTGGISYRF